MKKAKYKNDQIFGRPRKGKTQSKSIAIRLEQSDIDYLNKIGGGDKRKAVEKLTEWHKKRIKED